MKTDSTVLKWVSERAEATKNRRMLKWLMDVRVYDITVQHIKGTSNVVADALSRSPQDNEDASAGCFIGAIIPVGYEPRELAIMQHADEEIRQLVLTTQEIGDRTFVNTGEYFMDKGILYRHNDMPGRKNLLVVPSIMRQSFIREYHDTPSCGHHGREKTLARIHQRFYWPNMAQSVRHYVRSCHFCRLFKAKVGKKAGKLQPLRPPMHPFDQLGIEHFGPFRTSDKGKKHLIILIDYLSRYVEGKAVKSTDSASVTRFFRRRINARHGYPSKLISDGGTAFYFLPLRYRLVRCM